MKKSKFLLVFLLTLYAVYSVLRLFGVLDITQTATKTKNTIEVARKNNKDRRKIVLIFIKKCHKVTQRIVNNSYEFAMQTRF